MTCRHYSGWKKNGWNIVPVSLVAQWQSTWACSPLQRYIAPKSFTEQAPCKILADHFSLDAANSPFLVLPLLSQHLVLWKLHEPPPCRQHALKTAVFYWNANGTLNIFNWKITSYTFLICPAHSSQCCKLQLTPTECEQRRMQNENKKLSLLSLWVISGLRLFGNSFTLQTQCWF